MTNKPDIEKIKLLLPDYITGALSEDEAQLVKNAIDASMEVKSLYLDMKNALEFTGAVKYKEPAPQYWNNLLPRIHGKIDEREQKSLAKNPLPYIWKVLVPAAAVILIFIVYRISFTPSTEMSEKEQKNINNEKVEKNDVVEQKTPVEKNIEKPVLPKSSEGNIADKNNIKPGNLRHQKPGKIQKPGNLENKTNDIEMPLSKEDILKEKIDTKDLASFAEIDELSIFGAGTTGTIDDDIENELYKLSDYEQDELLNELSKSNL